MRTLDEVVKAYEQCAKSDWEEGCGDCAYRNEKCGSCKCVRNDDALHYLRQLQLFRQTPLMQGIHKAQKENALYPVEDWGEENLPLTWDELKGMAGKPVWFEGYAGKFWCIIREVQRNMDGTEDIVLDGPSGMTGVGHDDLYGTRWQAYRKEQTDENA